jgi:hypothetical protein
LGVNWRITDKQILLFLNCADSSPPTLVKLSFAFNRAGSQAFYKVIKVEVIFFAIQKDKIQVPLKKEKKQTPPDNHTGI